MTANNCKHRLNNLGRLLFGSLLIEGRSMDMGEFRTEDDYFSQGHDNYPINDGCIYDDQGMSGVPSGYSPIKNKQFFKG
jgi:hypothetical protein